MTFKALWVRRGQKDGAEDPTDGGGGCFRRRLTAPRAAACRCQSDRLWKMPPSERGACAVDWAVWQTAWWRMSVSGVSAVRGFLGHYCLRLFGLRLMQIAAAQRRKWTTAEKETPPKWMQNRLQPIFQRKWIHTWIYLLCFFKQILSNPWWSKINYK